MDGYDPRREACVNSIASRVRSASRSCAVRSASSIQMLPARPSHVELGDHRYPLPSDITDPPRDLPHEPGPVVDVSAILVLAPVDQPTQKELGKYRRPKRSSTASTLTATCAAAPNWSITRRISSRVISRQYGKDTGLMHLLGATGVTPVRFLAPPCRHGRVARKPRPRRLMHAVGELTQARQRRRAHHHLPRRAGAFGGHAAVGDGRHADTPVGDRAVKRDQVDGHKPVGRATLRAPQQLWRWEG